jgi:hypothetical protein
VANFSSANRFMNEANQRWLCLCQTLDTSSV